MTLTKDKINYEVYFLSAAPLRELLSLYRFAIPIIPQRCQRGFIALVCTYLIDRTDDHWDS